MEETKNQINSRLAIIESLNLNGEVDNYNFSKLAKGGLMYSFKLSDKKEFTVCITKSGVLSNYGSSRITNNYFKNSSNAHCTNKREKE